eukprot:m.211402 g.211402  ORF g.211402 m.211402 type:complete len:53 (+) comp39759_c0_seq33:1292-1450(+)
MTTLQSMSKGSASIPIQVTTASSWACPSREKDKDCDSDLDEGKVVNGSISAS